MNNNIPQTDQSSVAKPKRIVERSAAYPVISIERAIQFVDAFAKNFPGSPYISREDIAAVLKTKATHIHRDIAAASHYGLLNRKKETYQITELYKTICNHLSDAEKRKCLLQAFGSPKLYQDLINNHDGHVIPPELRTILIRFHRIAEKVAHEVAALFIENAKFTGAANEHNILNYKLQLEKVSAPGFEYAEVVTETIINTQTNANSGQIIDLITPQLDEHKTPKDQLRLPDIPNSEDIKIPLSGKQFAFLRYPSNIKKKDIEILRKQLDLLELLAE